MSTTTLYLYSGSNWELLPEKLLIVDNIDDYLATKTATLVNNFQYIKNQLELSIVLNASQVMAQPKHASYRYVKILDNDSGYTFYYYVKKVEWTAQSSIRLNLVMDVLNTYKEGTHYTFKANTRIIREHKNRFTKYDFNIVFSYGSTSVVGSGPTDGDNIYLAVSNDLSVPYFSGVLVETTASTFELNFPDIDMSALQTWMNAIQSAGFFVCLCKESSNAVVFNDGAVVISSYDYSLYRNIDEIPENINPLLQCDNALGIKVEADKAKLDDDWYLLYRNQNNPDPNSYVNPVDCFLIPNQQKPVLSGLITSGQIIAGALNANYFYYVNITGSQTLTLSNGVTLDTTAIWASQAKQYCMFFKDINGMLHVDFCGVNISNQIVGIRSYSVKYITLNQIPTQYCVYGNQVASIGTLYYDFSNNYQEWDTDNVTQYIYGIDSLDRTDPKNIKLIKLPYCPYDFTITSNKIDLTNGDWNYDVVGGMPALKLNDLNTKLHVGLKKASPNPFYELYLGVNSSINPSINNLRKNATYESKLYHSEFHQPTFYYDSFAFKVQLEKCDLSHYIGYDNYAYNEIDFDMTKTINSKFMFTFKNYYLRNAEQNYAKYLPIARNNEEVLYNVPYINYIRTGFNYDVKQKNITNISNWLGVGLSAVSIGASLFAPTASLKVAGVVGSVVSMAVSIKSAITSTIQGEENIKQKLLQAQNQTASVAGSDDVDLMSIYAENRLKYLAYEPREVMKNMLFDLFFYAGYNSGRMGIPNHNTRVNFDYLEADAVMQKLTAIPQECLNELINAFKNGVTYLHKTTRTTDKWDFEQKYENWEKDLI